jgi:hypothetical protein
MTGLGRRACQVVRSSGNIKSELLREQRDGEKRTFLRKQPEPQDSREPDYSGFRDSTHFRPGASEWTIPGFPRNACASSCGTPTRSVPAFRESVSSTKDSQRGPKFWSDRCGGSTLMYRRRNLGLNCNKMLDIWKFYGFCQRDYTIHTTQLVVHSRASKP